MADAMIGALLRYAWQAVRTRLLQGLVAAGFSELQAPHLAVFQHPGPDGVRPSVLARRAGMSKQAMNQLLGSLEQLGYLERRTDPRDGRARVVRLTARGHQVVAETRAILMDIEHDWAERLGAERFAALKAMLAEVCEGQEPVEHGPE
jgi:DNA-binding MarR family transcriptional regulator